MCELRCEAPLTHSESTVTHAFSTSTHCTTPLIRADRHHPSHDHGVLHHRPPPRPELTFTSTPPPPSSSPVSGLSPPSLPASWSRPLISFGPGPSGAPQSRDGGPFTVEPPRSISATTRPIFHWPQSPHRVMRLIIDAPLSLLLRLPSLPLPRLLRLRCGISHPTRVEAEPARGAREESKSAALCISSHRSQ